MSFDLILFDWGSTLAAVIGQDDRLREAANQIAALLAGPAHPPAAQALADLLLAADKQAAADPELRETDLPAYLSQWARLLGLEVDAQRLEHACDLIGRMWQGSLQPFPGAKETLCTLRDRGYRLGLVSNVMFPPTYCWQELARMGFLEYFQIAVFSSGVGFRKPSPHIYNAALQAAFPGGPPADLGRVLFVGDSPTFDVVAPARMGMKTAMVRCDKNLWTDADYALAQPDFRIDAVSELLALLD
jgi:putative hydrolase of the HAD superfamily